MQYFSSKYKKNRITQWIVLLFALIFLAVMCNVYSNAPRIVSITCPKLFNASPNQVIAISVQLESKTRLPLSTAQDNIRLSYHVKSVQGQILQFDNPRFDFELPPWSQKTLELRLQAPSIPGDYLYEFDLVVEGSTWYADKGNATAVMLVTVKDN